MKKSNNGCMFLFAMGISIPGLGILYAFGRIESFAGFAISVLLVALVIFGIMKLQGGFEK